MEVEESTNEQINEKEDTADSDKQQTKLTRLPHTRVRHMMKLDPDLHIASQDSVFLITRAAELFIQTYTEMAYKRTVAGKRKTIQRKDLDAVVDEVDCMAFLDGVLD